MCRAARGRYVDPGSPRGYYVDYSYLAGSTGGRDGGGLPELRARVDGIERSPLDVARFGLGNLELYLSTGSAARREGFERAAAWLIENIETVPASFGGWAMHPAPPPYRSELPTGRFAAGAQGECLSTVVRAQVLLGLPRAGDVARNAFAAFTAPVEDGGFLREVGDPAGEAGVETPVFLEEYPIEGRPVMNLSGHMRGMLGVYDYWRASRDEAAGSMWRRSLSGLRFVLDRYDLGYWTLDDLDGGRGRLNVTTVSSLREHVLHLSVLSDLAADATLRTAADTWREYLRSPLRGPRALRARLSRAAKRGASGSPHTS
ncbi:MAG: hypothetical protein GF400_06150 [Candidatus Eisenbacteria bacterium]|nr:hypothetical protein [Candidatus Eisenbacteria bacterium]